MRRRDLINEELPFKPDQTSSVVVASLWPGAVRSWCFAVIGESWRRIKECEALDGWMDWKQRANSINKQWLWGDRHDQKKSGRLVRIVVGSWRGRGWARFEVVNKALKAPDLTGCL